jgi:hypothetical protein
MSHSIPIEGDLRHDDEERPESFTGRLMPDAVLL